MKFRYPLMALVAAAAILGLSGCGEKESAETDLDTAVREMEKAPAAPAPASTAQTSQPAPAQEMKQAIASYNSGNLQDAVVRLHTLREQQNLSPQQRLTLQDAMGKVINDIYARAAAGDAQAQAAVREYERRQTAPR